MGAKGVKKLGVEALERQEVREAQDGMYAPPLLAYTPHTCI